MTSGYSARRAFWIGLLVAAAVSVGCASSSGRKWDPLIGHYRYDEAVKEYGPPDRKETTTDGTLVAEWTLVRGMIYSTPGFVVGGGWGGGWRRPWGWGGVADVHSTPDSLLRLQFGPDGQLQSWKKYHK
jgi:hypothetical protein